MKQVVLIVDTGYPSRSINRPYQVSDRDWAEYINESVIHCRLSEYAWTKAVQYSNEYEYSMDDVECYFEEYDVVMHGPIKDSAWLEIK